MTMSNIPKNCLRPIYMILRSDWISISAAKSGHVKSGLYDNYGLHSSQNTIVIVTLTITNFIL